MVSIKEEGDHVAPKLPSKIPVSARRPSRKKPKDKPKRPLSAYNYFFKEEREKILKLLEGGKDVENDPSSDDYISETELEKLRKNDKDGTHKSPKFEELGKLIGTRWKALPPDRLTKYSELASEDTERYRKEMTAYNGRQEAKMRDEALNKPPPPAYHPHHHQYPGHDGKALGGGQPPRAPVQVYDMNQMSSAAAYAQQQQAMSYGYPMGGMDSYGYPAMYGGGAGGGGYGAYPIGTPGGTQPPNMGYPPTGPDPNYPPEMQQQQQAAYGVYGAPPPGASPYPPPSGDPYGGMYGGGYGGMPPGW
mmetsp:Transcript_11225/g.21464  ORF Transcript_11225/g.21464 Transcript_11225/m.21464 type:complete len:305 (-) Transcript_11225:214-1128(-)